MAYLLMKGKKAMTTLEMVGSIILVMIVVITILGGWTPLFGSVKDIFTRTRSCDGMGFAGGVCVAENDIVDCSVRINGLGCSSSTPVCCFKEDSETPGSVGPVSLAGAISVNPPTARVGTPVIVSCDTNIQARGCILVDYSDNRMICQTETWTTYTPSGGTSTNQVQFSCLAPAQRGSYTLRCRLDTSKCNLAGGGRENSNTVPLSVT
jgi:hypothetical protein